MKMFRVDHSPPRTEYHVMQANRLLAAVGAFALAGSGGAAKAQPAQSLTASPTADAKATEVAPTYFEIKELDLRRRPGVITPTYPSEAEKLGVAGEATIDCAIVEGGHIADCFVVNESPTNVGFGETTKAIFTSGAVRVGPKLRSGEPLPRGARTKFHMKFRLPS